VAGTDKTSYTFYATSPADPDFLDMSP